MPSFPLFKPSWNRQWPYWIIWWRPCPGRVFLNRMLCQELSCPPARFCRRLYPVLASMWGWSINDPEQWKASGSGCRFASYPAQNCDAQEICQITEREKWCISSMGLWREEPKAFEVGSAQWEKYFYTKHSQECQWEWLFTCPNFWAFICIVLLLLQGDPTEPSRKMLHKCITVLSFFLSSVS